MQSEVKQDTYAQMALHIHGRTYHALLACYD